MFTRTGAKWTERAKLTASDGASDNHFGVSVALDSDPPLIGAPRDYSVDNAVFGAAYFFDLDLEDDGLLNKFELAVGTDPKAPDTHGDGISDGDEDPDGDGSSDLDEQNNRHRP